MDRIDIPSASIGCNGRAGLSADMSIRIEKAFCVSMETLMRMLNSFDIAQARQHENKMNVARYAVF